MNKKILNGTILAILAFGIVYMLGGFVQLSLDITKWSYAARAFVALFGSMVSVLAFACGHDFTANE